MTSLQNLYEGYVWLDDVQGNISPLVTHASDTLQAIVVVYPQSLDCDFPATVFAFQYVRKPTTVQYNTRRIIV